MYYLLGSVYQRQNQPANSMQVYEMGLVQPPILPWTAKTLWALARLQEERQELARAVELYQRLAQDFPTYEKADLACGRPDGCSIASVTTTRLRRSGKALNSAFRARHCSPRCSTGRPGWPSREGSRIPPVPADRG